MSGPRSLLYQTWRVCERFGLKPAEFQAFSYPQQLQLLAYELIRSQEERAEQ